MAGSTSKKVKKAGRTVKKGLEEFFGLDEHSIKTQQKWDNRRARFAESKGGTKIKEDENQYHLVACDEVLSESSPELSDAGDGFVYPSEPYVRRRKPSVLQMTLDIFKK